MFRFALLIVASFRLVATEPVSVQDQLELANSYFKAQRLSEASAIASQVLRVAPGNPPAMEIIGNVHYLEGDTKAAINTFIDLLDQHPQNQAAPYMLGRIYYQEGSIDQSIGQFERLLMLNPSSYKAYDNLGLCFEAKREDDKAMVYFVKAIQLAAKEHPDYDVAYADLAELMLKKGEAEKAFGAASKAADRNPRSARNFYLGGKALEQVGKIELSLNWLQRSAALDPHYPEPLYALARIYERLGQAPKAAEVRNKFLALKAKEHSPPR